MNAILMHKIKKILRAIFEKNWLQVLTIRAKASKVNILAVCPYLPPGKIRPLELGEEISMLIWSYLNSYETFVSDMDIFNNDRIIQIYKWSIKYRIYGMVWYGMVCRRLPELKVPKLYFFFFLHQHFL